jgi:hypothetical protein
MATFELISVALSFVLGLAVTLVLSSLLVAFRHRKRVSFDWIPFVWAGYVLLLQFQFWWAIIGLREMPQWHVTAFGLLLLMTMILFLAGGLVLPTASTDYPTDLTEYFRADGRGSVVALASYLGAGTLGNIVLFGLPLVSTLHALHLAAIVIAGLLVASTPRAVHATATIAFGLVVLAAVLVGTPAVH